MSVKRLLLTHGGAAAMLMCFWALAVTASLEKNVHYDEGLHLVAGYSYWLTNDYRLQPENGNLPQRWVGLPLWLAGTRFPGMDQDDYHVAHSRKLSEQLLHDSELGNDAGHILFLGRACNALWGVALGWLIYAWSRQLFGAGGGYISLVLFVLSPTMLSFAAIATSDMAAGFFFVAATYALWQLLHRGTAWSLLSSCLAMAGLFLAKFSAPLIVPIGLLLALVWLKRRAPLVLAVFAKKPKTIASLGGRLLGLAGLIAIHVLFVWLCIWASFGFRYEMRPHHDPSRDQLYPEWSEVLKLESKRSVDVLEWSRNWQVLPEGYLYGFAHTLHFARMRAAFLHGEIRFFGWTSYFPCTFLWKTPLPVFAMVPLAVWGWRRGRRSAAADNPWPFPDAAAKSTLPLWVLWAVYWLAALGSSLNIGHRHILPTYSPLFILAGASVNLFRRLPSELTSPPRRRWAPTFLCGLLAVHTVESVCFFPHYLSYFNQLTGGAKNGHQYLVDSSLDWGQDLIALRKWLDAHPTSEPAHLIYFGTGDPKYYGVAARSLATNADPVPSLRKACQGGLYCVSATSYQSVYFRYPGHWNWGYEKRYEESLQRGGADIDDLALSRLVSYLRHKKPMDQAAYSMLIFRLTAAEVHEAFAGDPVEFRSNIGDEHKLSR